MLCLRMNSRTRLEERLLLLAACLLARWPFGGLCASIYAVNGCKRFGVDWMDEDETDTTEVKEEEA